jgi:hypothetical protein
MFVPNRNHTYGPPRPVTGIALLYICRSCWYFTGITPMDLQGLLRVYLQFLYVDYVHTSQKSHFWASTACYWDNFGFYMQMIFVLHWKHAYGPPRSVTGTTLLFTLSFCILQVVRATVLLQGVNGGPCCAPGTANSVRSLHRRCHWQLSGQLVRACSIAALPNVISSGDAHKMVQST